MSLFPEPVQIYDPFSKWMYEATPGNWLPVLDAQIESRFRQWEIDHIEHQYVYHCFGDRGSVFVNFSTMRTECGSAHRCETENCNVFNLRRTFEIMVVAENDLMGNKKNLKHKKNMCNNYFLLTFSILVLDPAEN